MIRRTSILFTAAALALVGVQTAAAQRGCTLPQNTFPVISFSVLELVPGQSHTLHVGVGRGPYAPPEPLPRACRVRWLVDAGAPARIDQRGRLMVNAAARPGTEFLVRAVVAGDTARQPVHVVDPRPNPLAATWRQTQPAECAIGGESVTEPVRELIFRRDGRFSVTFLPFETYNDYWGRYTYDQATGALTMRIERGNNVPPGVDLEGTARITGDRLVLEGMWLGQPRPVEPRACTYRFDRRAS